MNIKVHNVFHQSADSGIPSHWCVQYTTGDNGFAQYEYFATEEEAWEWVYGLENNLN